MKLPIILILAIVVSIMVPLSSSAASKEELETLMKERDVVLLDMKTASDEMNHDQYSLLNTKLEELDTKITEMSAELNKIAAEKNQAATAVIYYNEGTNNLKAGRYQAAIDKYNESIAVEPNNPQAYYNMGFAFLRLRKQTEAQDAFKKALEYNSNYADAHSALGNISLKQKDNTTAFDHFNQAVALDSTQYKAWYGIGNIHLKSRSWKEAEDNYRKAVAVKSDYSEAWISLGRALSEQPDKSGAALEALEKGVSLDSGSFQGYYFLASIHNKVNDFSKALEATNKCTSIKPNYYPAWNEKGIALMNLGRKQEAITAFEKSKEGGSQWRKLAEYYIKKCKGLIE